MSHYAKLGVGNVVEQVIVAEQDFIDTQEGVWVQTSYNTKANVHKLGGTPFRKNFAGIGYRYDETLDGFIPPQPHGSWSLNETTCLWEAPLDYPTDENNTYRWDESVYQADNTQGWVIVNTKE